MCVISLQQFVMMIGQVVHVWVAILGQQSKGEAIAGRRAESSAQVLFMHAGNARQTWRHSRSVKGWGMWTSAPSH
jgi:hypothetical protein